MKDRATVVPLFPSPEGASPALDERSDDELMRLCATGLQAALAALLRRHEGAVRAFCRRWDPVRGDDLAQEVFLEVWRQRERYRPEGRFRVYLFTLVRNRCRNAWRELFRRTRAHGRLPSAGEAVAPSQLDALLRAEEDARVGAAVQRLSPKLREALLLRFGQGLSHAEVAAIVGVPEVTVRSRVFLAVQALREQLGEVKE